MRTLQADPSKRQPGDRPIDYKPLNTPKTSVYERLTHARVITCWEPLPDPYALTMGEYARYLRDVGESYDPSFAAWLRSRV